MDQNGNRYTQEDQSQYEQTSASQAVPEQQNPNQGYTQPGQYNGANNQYYPPQYNQPMYNRSANGQYNMPPQYAYYPAPQGVPVQPPRPVVDTRPGSPLFDKETFKEKSAIRRIGNAVGMSLSMFNLAGLIVQLAVLAVMYVVLGVTSTTWQMNNPNTLYLINAVTTLFVLTLPYIFAAKHAGVGLSELVPFKKTSFTKVITLIMLGMGVCSLSNFATSAISSLFDQIFGFQSEPSMDGYGTGLESFLLMLLCVGILPAVLEEFALRGVVMGLLRKRFSDGTAIVISAVLFGLLHGNLQQIPFAFGVGLILGYATVYSGSLLPAMLIHAMNNSMSVILSFASESVSPMTSQVIMLLYYAVSLMMGLCGFIMLAKTDKTALRLSKENTENTKRNVKWFFGSAWMIVFVILCVMNVLVAQGLIAA